MTVAAVLYWHRDKLTVVDESLPLHTLCVCVSGPSLIALISYTMCSLERGSLKAPNTCLENGMTKWKEVYTPTSRPHQCRQHLSHLSGVRMCKECQSFQGWAEGAGVGIEFWRTPGDCWACGLLSQQKSSADITLLFSFIVRPK